MEKQQINDFLDAFIIAAPEIRMRTHYRRSLARMLMTIHMMRADAVVKPEECDFIRDLIARKFNLDQQSADNLRLELCDENNHAPSIETLVAYIKAHSSEVERADCVREMWEVAICDKELHTLEDSFAYRCAEMLGVEFNEVTWLQELASSVHHDPRGNGA